MDENYLDNLLNEFSLDKEIDNQIEDELDDQIAKEKEQHQKERTPSQDDLFNMDLDQDATEGVLDQDFSFSEDQMNELDELGDLADLDIGDVDFSDIDFDDLDITKLDDLDDSNLDDLLKDFEGDLNINRDYEGKDEAKEAALETSVQEVEDGQNREEQPSEPMQEDLNEDHFDADNFLDSLIQDEEKQEARITRDRDEILASDRVVLPGVGSFGDAMSKIKEYKLEQVIYDVIDKKVPFLGICLGLQLLFESSDESKGVSGLGILKGTINRIPEQEGLKIPHMGWNSL